LNVLVDLGGRTRDLVHVWCLLVSANWALLYLVFSTQPITW
jgi:hypothetical protein